MSPKPELTYCGSNAWRVWNIKPEIDCLKRNTSMAFTLHLGKVLGFRTEDLNFNHFIVSISWRPLQIHYISDTVN